jgi:hypothetical protein
MLTRDQIYSIVRETVAAFGSLSPTMPQKDFEQIAIADFRIDATNITPGFCEKDFMIRLQGKFMSQKYQVNINENDIFKNPKITAMGHIIDLCADRIVAL